MGARLPLSFYQGPDVVAISRALLGKWVFTRLPGEPVTGGRIVETEAYAGPEDRASHAYGNRQTARTETMYWAGGVAYVYFCYGVHHMLNVVTNVAGVPHAILIRAIEPTQGLETLRRRCGKPRIDRTLTSGPGRVARALGLDRRHNGVNLRGGILWIEDRGETVAEADIVAGPRVGVEYAGAHARRPWRFRIRHSPWTSRAK